ncbi:hypothetical protein [Vreelandella nigrificans]|uniref:Uncharacterized protein n=1 Tax=Vreelandella nigrificans TaxID=2042704 RepID=A0A2A4HIN9_9GAMM|nr:hypothetical protein [Halomonas nigrificans]PCF94055.1 hypothetical protein CPA45_18935 [Halomonas nigrificans]
MARTEHAPNPIQELHDLETRLQALRDELRALEKECCSLREQRRQLIQSLEGQLDLFRDQMSLSEQLLKEVRHGSSATRY